VPRLRSRGLLPAEPPPVPVMERPLRVLTRRRSHSSHLKISEGCDHTCAFCAIPLMRGRHRSTPIDLLVREARELEAQGVVELNIVSQDTTWYGRDLARGVDAGGAPDGTDSWYVGRTFAGMAGVAGAAAQSRVADRPGQAGGAPRKRGAAGAGATVAGGTAGAARSAGIAGSRRGLLPGLLEALLAETAIPWLRLFYMYPSGIRPELVELMARAPRLLPYLDMPIQHGSDSVLRRMRRPERRATIRERVGWLRAAVPDLALRTTVIVGFPGETDEEFEELLDLLEEIRFDRVGAFTYSAEENTLAAGMAEQVPAEVQRERLERLLDVARGIAQERSEGWIGREVEVLIDGPGVGRTKGQAPEVDGVVLLDGAEHARAGQVARVRITGAQEEDLVGTVTGVVRA
jgi:tRNA A37 methylthiotransferase MiaB